MTPGGAGVLMAWGAWHQLTMARLAHRPLPAEAPAWPGLSATLLAVQPAGHPRAVRQQPLKRADSPADALSVAVTSEPDPSPAAGVEAPPTAVARAAAAWGVHPARPGLCPAEWRRPGEVWRCDRSYGHRWRHHYVRD